MTMKAASVATDFGQYTSLRAEARGQSPEALRKTAQQFESLMLQQMMKSMRAASGGDDVMGSQQTSFYQEMFDQQLSVSLASGKGIGIADMLVKQLQMSQSLSDPNASVVADAGASDPAASGIASLASLARPAAGSSFDRPLSLKLSAISTADHAAGMSSTTATATATATAAAADAGDFRPQTPQEFIDALLPHAEKAAKELGVPARVLVAQAALETGWGRHQIRNADGTPSFNLFGIKADRGWNGDRVGTVTTEYEGGKFEKQSASFRAYGSVAEAFDDYAHFLKSNPRYGDALRHQGSAHQFVSGLQKAGYATDPGYASKILRIAQGNTMQLAMAKLAGARTMTA